METKNTLETIYIDLSKCSGEQRKHIFSLLPKKQYKNQYKISEYHFILHWIGVWDIVNDDYDNKTELTYPEFIKLFKGGEGTEVQKLKKQIDLYKECFELFIPTDKWDEANEFLSINKNPLAKHLSRVQKEVEKKPKF